MKKLILISAVALIAFSCKKADQEPLGPTDVRIKNITTVSMDEVTVNTFDSTFNYGTIEAGDTSLYHRFDRAYPVANIRAMINGQLYKTDTATYYGGNYLGQMKVMYQIWIVTAGKLGMSVIAELPLK